MQKEMFVEWIFKFEASPLSQYRYSIKIFMLACIADLFLNFFLLFFFFSEEAYIACNSSFFRKVVQTNVSSDASPIIYTQHALSQMLVFSDPRRNTEPLL